jgi:hypothetical protein
MNGAARVPGFSEEEIGGSVSVAEYARYGHVFLVEEIVDGLQPFRLFQASRLRR